MTKPSLDGTYTLEFVPITAQESDFYSLNETMQTPKMSVRKRIWKTEKKKQSAKMTYVMIYWPSIEKDVSAKKMQSVKRKR